MVSHTNFLLVGNSRLHWAESYKNQFTFFHTEKKYKVPQDLDLNNLIWASVGKLPNFLLNETNEITIKDINLSNLPHFFGVDRAFACLGALDKVNNPLKKDLLIADFGTIFSLTKINAKRSIIGGQLAAGFRTQLKSIELYSKNLKAPNKYEIPKRDFLIQTDDAILKGVTNSLVGLINSAFNPSKDILITCGGDCELITKILEIDNRDIICSPNLVMEGMISHIQYSK
ncbi:type III pantothenate kinase [Prochlorococcus sp. AH-736-K09]|nr:type III pantothenate kinase [Prochlorococcus sp. AH-736-K09]